MNKYLLSLAMAVAFIGCGSSGGTKEELAVKILIDKTEIAEGQSITFDSNVTGADGTITYTWLDGNDRLSTDKSFTKSDFTLGEHTIVLNVTDGDKNATDSKTIKVSEYLVSLFSSKSRYSLNYGIDENITFEANVTANRSIAPIYRWYRDGKQIVGADSNKIAIDDFNASSHNVLVSVSIDGIEKNSSIDFNVSDFSELNVTSVLNDDVIIQKISPTKKLMWVSDADKSKKACLAVHYDKQNEITESQTFCKNLNFAGFSSGWRKPTVSEVSDFIVKTVNANILPVYYAPCKILIGTDVNGIDQAVITRYGKAKSFGDLGAIYDTMEQSLSQKKNIGLRCVRDIP